MMADAILDKSLIGRIDVFRTVAGKHKGWRMDIILSQIVKVYEFASNSRRVSRAQFGQNQIIQFGSPDPFLRLGINLVHQGQ